jgi:chromosome segregation ATPase
VTLGLLVSDQVTADDRSHRAQASLGVTRQETHSVSAQLAALRRDLNVLETQVGSDSTALSQDASQLLGAQTSLAAAQVHVTRQSSLITSLQTCLVGVEQALNQLSVGQQEGAIASLNSVASSCSDAEASSG